VVAVVGVEGRPCSAGALYRAAEVADRRKVWLTTWFYISFTFLKSFIVDFSVKPFVSLFRLSWLDGDGKFYFSKPTNLLLWFPSNIL
jgi:hypothetical protein